MNDVHMGRTVYLYQGKEKNKDERKRDYMSFNLSIYLYSLFYATMRLRDNVQKNIWDIYFPFSVW